MAKQIPGRASKQEKVTLRGTPVGSRVIARLSLPNIDKSAELRRLIELGFACEQAGFILDGEILRQAGRAWNIQPDLDRVQRYEPLPEFPPISQGAQPMQKPSTLGADPAAAAPASARAGEHSDAASENSMQADQMDSGSSLLMNLRGLSG